MVDRYNEFVHLDNIKHFEKMLGTETDPERRAMLLKLLAEEKAGKLSPPSAPKPATH
ncbi:hypothetical protein ACVDG5_002940 [Mesorhizobium sp. ORM6]